MTTRIRPALPAVLFLGLVTAFTPARPDEPKKPAAGPPRVIVPTDVTAFVSLDVAKAWDHKALLPVREARGKLEFAWAVQSLVGLAPAEMKRITAFWNPAGKDAPFVLITGRKAIDPKAVVKLLSRAGAKPPATPRVGKVLVAPGAEFRYVLPVDARTILLAPKSADPGGLEKLTGTFTALTTAVGKHTLTVGINVKAIADVPLPVGGPLLEADTAVLTADLTEENSSTAELRLTFASAGKAKAAAPFLKTKLDELAGWAAAQEKRATEKGQVGTGYPAPLLEWIVKALKGARVRADGPAAVATAALKIDEGINALMAAVPDAALAPRGPSAAENNLKQIGLAFHNYADANAACVSNTYDKDGKPLLSWRVHLLPYIEQAPLYNRFKLDEPWDSPHNKPLGQSIVKVYQVPGRPTAQPWETYFRGFILPKGTKVEGGRPWLTEGETKGPNFPAAFPDGTSNTWLVVEAAEAVPWAKPDDLPFDGKLPLPKLGGANGSYGALFADGSVRTFRRGQIDDGTMRFLIMRDDGNPVNIPGR